MAMWHKRGRNLVLSILLLRQLNGAWQIGLQASELAKLLQRIECHQDEVYELRFHRLPHPVEASHRTLENQLKSATGRTAAGAQRRQPKIFERGFVVACALRMKGKPLVLPIEVDVKRSDCVDRGPM